MDIPVDTREMSFIAVGSPEPVTDFETKRAKVAATGEPMFIVQVVVMLPGVSSELIKVKVPGEPSVAPGQPVRIDGLVANAWQIDGKSGVAFRARALAPVAAPAKSAA